MKLKDLCFEIIEKCTNNCMFCSSCSTLEKTRKIELIDFKRVIDHFVSTGGIEEISLSGGEPLLHPDLEEMISYCNFNKIKTTIYTSGVILNEPMSIIPENLLESEKILLEKIKNKRFLPIGKEELWKLKKAGLNKIVFDLQSIDEENYDYLMGTKRNITNVMQSIIYANSLEIESEIHFIPLKINIADIDDILEIAEIGEIKQVSILRFVPQGRGRHNKESLILSDSELEEFLVKLKTQKHYSGNIRIGIPLEKDNTHLCSAGRDKLSIRYDGAILPCPAFKELKYESVQNIYDDLEKININSGFSKEPLCKKIHKNL